MPGPDEDSHPRVQPTRLRGPLRRVFAGLGDLLVPPVCIACQRPLETHDALCARCWRGVSFIRPPVCHRLGIPLPFAAAGDGPLLSAAAAAHPPVYDRARAVARYEPDGVLRDLIHALKYSDRHDARRLFGRWLAEAGRELLADASVIVPVPVTRWRLMRRQFNQAALLAHEVSRLSGVPADPLLLRKVRSTPPQVGLPRGQRRQNVRGAFAVPVRLQAKVAGARIVLLDDVITTGATAEACARPLLAAGAASVDVLAVGLVTEPRQVTV